MKISRPLTIGLTTLAWVLLLFVGCIQDQQKSKDNDTPFQYNQTKFSQAFPWTGENFKNNPANFQFAIIGDRTGGANVKGTYAAAMDQLNLLQPEFVINVGDLIEGYTREKEELHSQWNEVEGLISKLKMPFFYTPGNHDLSYPEAKEVWNERFGQGYYSFLYHNVLFLVLNSEDAQRMEPPPGMEESIKLYNRLQTENPQKAKEMLAEFMKDEAVVAGLTKPVEFPEEQLNWIKNTLQEHSNVRWTFLFMHEPAWENPSESFREIQLLLKGRSFTWFAGHLHYYDYDNIDGSEYITMGPAGASWHHDGPGNVDHITWVTMKEEGPEIGNIALKGIFDRKGLDTTMFGAYDRKGLPE
ncbi:metallophosphoesterase family protein [Lutimonas zeaxanthinifaciens]|uniref:metallophosphoesterase family protein n=1 Tax=Lutimonas zeaxanthinifaciens TaxID=3060215 RepID=UPI00265CEAF5|nr:metallophosphoesterase [Lutimonas sp. YSD2104]WKK65916.1 metallophosphoesterase [Lutimonas sp. YSD2104]